MGYASPWLARLAALPKARSIDAVSLFFFFLFLFLSFFFTPFLLDLFSLYLHCAPIILPRGQLISFVDTKLPSGVSALLDH